MNSDHPPVEPKTMAAGALRVHLSEVIEAAHYRNEPTIVTVNGRPRAAVVPYAWIDSMRRLEANGDD